MPIIALITYLPAESSKDSLSMPLETYVVVTWEEPVGLWKVVMVMEEGGGGRWAEARPARPETDKITHLFLTNTRN